MGKEGLPFATLMIVVTGLFVIAMLYFGMHPPMAGPNSTGPIVPAKTPSEIQLETNTQKAEAWANGVQAQAHANCVSQEQAQCNGDAACIQKIADQTKNGQDDAFTANCDQAEFWRICNCAP